MSEQNKDFDNFVDYVTAVINRFSSWAVSEDGKRAWKLLVFALQLLFVIGVCALIVVLLNAVYSKSPTEAHSIVLITCGTIAAGWALARWFILTDKLFKRLREAKREKMEIPFNLWCQKICLQITKSDLARTYRERLEITSNVSEAIVKQHILWPLLPLLELNLSAHTKGEFLGSTEISNEIKNSYGTQVLKRYEIGDGLIMFGCITLNVLVLFATFFVNLPLVKLAELIIGSLAVNLSGVVYLLFHLTVVFPFSVAVFWGTLEAFFKRRRLWYLPSNQSQSIDNAEYLELREHLSSVMDKLTATVGQLRQTENKLQQREQARKTISRDPKIANDIAVLIDWYLEEELSKAEKAKRRTARIDLITNIVINAVFFILGIVATIVLRFLGF